MSKVYKIHSDDKAVPMTRIHCKNEEKELQDLLAQNHDPLRVDQGLRPGRLLKFEVDQNS